MRKLAMMLLVLVAMLLLAACNGKEEAPQGVQGVPSLSTKKSEEFIKAVEGSLQKGLDFLFSQQKENGAIVGNERGGEQAALGATALAACGAARAPKQIRTRFEDKLTKACSYILRKQMTDGSFAGVEGLPTYTTALSIMALYNTDSQKYSEAVKRGQEYLIGAQYFADVKADDLNYGGWTYGKDEKAKGQKANLSTSHYAITALRNTGLTIDHDAF